MRKFRVRQKRRNGKSHSAVRHATAIGLLAFGMAALAGLASQSIVGRITFWPFALILLLIVIFIGIAFDVIGVAAMAAHEAPFHAMASRGVFGAGAAARLVRNAHRVASICNDVVGDVSGALSGAIGVSILFHLVRPLTRLHDIWAASLMTAAVAALIVAGKAYAKEFAMRHNVTVILRVGQILTIMGLKRSRR